MATNQYSILREYTPYKSPYNMELIQQAMAYKQGKIDANRAKINQQMDFLLGQDIMKEQDRAYLQNKAAAAIARINEMYRGADLSSDGITRHIQSEISDILDENVMNAIAGTKEVQRMQKILSEKEQRGDKDYSSVNAGVTMLEVQKWANDGKVGSRLNPLHYTPYHDYSKEAQDAVVKLRGMNKAAKVSVPILDDNNRPTGEIKVITKDQMTQADIATFVRGILSDKAREQMRIEGVYLANTNPNAFNFNTAVQFAQQQLNAHSSHIKEIESKIAAESNPETKAQYEELLKSLKSGYASNLESMNRMSPNAHNPEAFAQYMIQENFINGISAAYAYDNTSYEQKKDEAYFERERLAREDRRYAFDVEKWRVQVEMEREQNAVKERQGDEKLAIEAAKAAGKGRGANRAYANAMAADYSGMTVTNSILDTKDIDVNKETRVKFGEAVARDYDSVERLAKALGEGVAGSIYEDMMSEINADLRNGSSTYAGMDKREMMEKWLSLNKYMNNGKIVALDEATRGKINEAYDEFLSAGNAMDKEYERISKERDVKIGGRTGVYNAIKERLGDGVHNGNANSEYNLWAIDSSFGDYTGKEMNDIKEGYISSRIASDYADLMSESSRIPKSERMKIFNRLGNMYELRSPDDIMNDGSISYEYRVQLSEESKRIGGYITGMELKTRVEAGDTHLMNQIPEVFFSARSIKDLQGVKAVDEKMKSDIEEIRSEYIKFTSDQAYTIQNNLTSTDPMFNALQHIRGITQIRMTEEGKKNLANNDILSYSIIKDGKDDKGKPTYAIFANTVDNEDTNGVKIVAQVSASELTQNGIYVATESNELDTDSYDSKIVNVFFGDPNDTLYAGFCEDQYDDVNKEYLLWLHSAPSANERCQTVVDALMSKVSDGDERKALFKNAVTHLINHAGDFGVRKRGWDFNVRKKYGDTMELYATGKNMEPVLISAADNKHGKAYMDEYDVRIKKMPQDQYTNMMMDLVKEEIAKAMSDKNYKLSKSSRLGKMLLHVGFEF